ncbi:MAG: family 10 glycosylhydrolase [Bacteroides sp.]|nr:family 10 glycosylhydrolase [Bacteroides sp.]MCM1379353.1 family 10 glycosylhydrolase [Bacteroides sp.]MCM1445213.1 family 10 glycosylhydrolase [Prevotella sp.]
MKRLLLFSLIYLISLISPAAKKHDFRGAWIQTIYQGYDKRTTAENQQYLTGLLDSLQAAGINAVIFQVRPRADALYRSDIEPWSRFISGEVGKAPNPEWDPLDFMIEQAHARGMELHAWLNPYRAAKVDEYPTLPDNDLLKTNPERFLKYGDGYYFNPAQQANRDLICRVVKDIAEHYDIDGIHFDDYFYPYPVPKAKFPDSKDYAAAKTSLSLPAWRRHNVDLLIEQVHATLDSVKPWIRFGISPFGIWRNASADPKRGSTTRGLSNYDDLYADVPLWAKKGWIDYQIPQLYWQMEHKSAPYSVLAPWWEKNGFGRHVYIGEDAENILKFDELDKKMKLSDAMDGHCWWYAASLPGLAPQLRERYYTTTALVPEYPWKSVAPASKPLHLRFKDDRLRWEGDKNARKWVVYRFNPGEKINIENPEAIAGVTFTPEFPAPLSGVYVVTALDRANRESLPSNPITIEL